MLEYYVQAKDKGAIKLERAKKIRMFYLATTVKLCAAHHSKIGLVFLLLIFFYIVFSSVFVHSHFAPCLQRLLILSACLERMSFNLEVF